MNISQNKLPILSIIYSHMHVNFISLENIIEYLKMMGDIDKEKYTSLMEVLNGRT